MRKDKWIWMPHAGHLIVGNDCRFHLNTYVGKYIVSTLGEYWPERGVREIHAQVYDPQWLKENIYLKGDDFNAAYFKRFGWEEIGLNRIYETMVFKAKKSKDKCCPWVMVSGEDVDMRGYRIADKAMVGHLALCNKWSKK